MILLSENCLSHDIFHMQIGIGMYDHYYYTVYTFDVSVQTFIFPKNNW